MVMDQAGLADLFTKDDQRYGLPKDWDTIAMFYDAAALRAAESPSKVGPEKSTPKKLPLE